MRESLAIHAPWDAVCSTLGIAAGRGLPVVVRCPRCGREALHVCQDTIKGFPWHQCKSCGSTGDLLRLLCNVWECGPPAALMRLGITDVADASLASYRADEDREIRMKQFFEDARRRLYAHPTHCVARLREKLQLTLTLDASLDRWLDGPGRIVGGAAAREAELAFHPHIATVTANAKFFPGGGWKDVLAFPFHDLPDRLAGFLFVGRDAAPRDYIYHRVYGDSKRPEAGLCNLPGAVEAVDGPVLAVPDPVFVAWMYVRNLRSGWGPLPMVAWHADGLVATTDAWVHLAGRRLIFWDLGRLNACLLAHAIRTNGRINTDGPRTFDTNAVSGWVRDRGSPIELLACLNANARPWRIELTRWLAEAREGAVADLLVDLERKGVDPHWVAGELKDEASDRLKLILAQRVSPELTFVWRGHPIKETDAGTFWQSAVNRNKLWKRIANFRLRVGQPTPKRLVGVLLQDGLSVPIDVPYSPRADMTRMRIETQVLAAGGKHLIVDHSWIGRLIRMALENPQPNAGFKPGGVQMTEGDSRVTGPTEGL